MTGTTWVRRIFALTIVCVVGAGAGSCDRRGSVNARTELPGRGLSHSSAPTSRSDGGAAGLEVPGPGLQHVHHLTPSIYCGSAPQDARAFAALRGLGIRTIITVDGMAPDVELARRFGLRYVHLPVGYDGISRERQREIGRAVRDLPGPVYIHCHHGLHRGPTAAVVAAMTCDGWMPDQAVRALAAIGTSPHYQGLFATARQFRPPTGQELDAADASFPPIARPAGLVATMVEVDRHWDNLKSARKRAWEHAPEHPDIEPEHEALLLRELFREAHRPGGPAATQPAELCDRLAAAERQAASLEAALRESDQGAAAIAADGLAESCTACHAKYRDVHAVAAAGIRDSLPSSSQR